MNRRKKISIFIMTRERTELLNRLLDSMVANVHDSKNIEVFIGTDRDDQPTRDFLIKYVGSNPSLSPIVATTEEKSAKCDGCKQPMLNRHSDLLFPMTEKCTGDYLWVLNDDITVMTPSFDEILLEQLEEKASLHEDRIVYGKVDEIFSVGRTLRCGSLKEAEKYACYPIISKELYNALGWFLPLENVSNEADIALARIMSRCIYNRKYTFNDIHIYDQVDSGDHKLVKKHRSDARLGPAGINRYVKSLEGYIKARGGSAESIKPYKTEVNFIYECRTCTSDFMQEVQIPNANVITCPRCATPHFVMDCTRDLPDNFQVQVTKIKDYLDPYRNAQMEFLSEEELEFMKKKSEEQSGNHSHEV